MGSYLVGGEWDESRTIYAWPDNKSVFYANGGWYTSISEDVKYKCYEEAAKSIYDAGLGPAKFVTAEMVPADVPFNLQPEIDLVNNPPHYKQGDIECIDSIKSSLTEEEYRGFLKGTAIAYIWREKHKGGDQDISKAMWYLNKLVKNGQVDVA